MTSLNPIAGGKALNTKMGPMQVLLLTAMTIFGFYLCFKEMRRLAMEVSSVKDRLEFVSEKVVSGKAVLGIAIGDDGLGDDGLGDDGDDGLEIPMDPALHDMLSRLNGAAAVALAPPVVDSAPAPPPAEVEEITEEKIPDAAPQKDPPVSMKKSELEAILADKGIPFKKTDTKAQLLEALTRADADTDAAADLAAAVEADDANEIVP